MARSDGRKNNHLRKVKITKNYTKHADGVCLIEFGDTRVLCSAMIEENVPPFLKNSGTGWVTAEYGMLPSSCQQRIRRNNSSGRIYEIQRLIGRSLRSVVDMEKLGERTIKIDCDVLQADGGTRTAAITGSFIALSLAIKNLLKEELIDSNPINDYVAAISVGIHNGENILDLKYDEDSTAQMDMNVVMVGKGQYVEIQGTAEGEPFTKAQSDALLKLAKGGIDELFCIQKRILNDR